ncbi:MAG: N-acetylneuraminate synthase [Alphaproteobacteria bacterium]|nr:N-acetylneuraminate synthase [Alphaproteobacteria bacterium]
MAASIRIGRHEVGDTSPTYFIADIAANHDGDIERAKDLIRLCASAGANAAKFQNFRAETIVSGKGFRDLGEQQSHQAKWEKSVEEVYRAASIPQDWSPILKETCDDAGIDYFTAPYDLDLLDDLSKHVCAWKVGSGDITWHASIEAMARTGKPILLATGASEMHEVRSAVEIVRRWTQDIVLMQCNTNYTAALENFRHVALNVLKTYAREFEGLVLGLSDHTPGHATVLGAVALGARAIEKHFTDDLSRKGPDHAFSMDPRSWQEMVDRTRELEQALGTDEKRVMENERETVVLQRRAIRARRPLPEGHRIVERDLIVLRPCPRDALPPYRIGELIGRVTRRSVAEGSCVLLRDVE